MKREIKFRAFYSGEMIEVGTLDFFTDGEITVNEELVGAKLMQFTGLKDKNGKEIYEGDILNTWTEDDESDEAKVVLFNEDSLQWDWGNNGGNSMPLYETEDICREIIGNIYEHPELLNPPTP